MESLKKFIEIGRQHYEKIILVLAVVVLGGAVWYLYLESQKEKEKIDEYFQTKGRQKVKPVETVVLTEFDKAKQALESPERLNLSLPHNLFNPVKWQRRPDGELIKFQTGTEVGPAAVKVTGIRPLHLSVALERPAGSGWWMVVTNELAPNRASARLSQFASLTTTNTRVFILREVKPADNPTEWVVEMRDTGQRVTVTREKPYERVEGYEVDLKYDVEGKTFKSVRAGTKLRLSNESYNVVDITPSEVLLSADSNDRRYSIKVTATP